MNWHGLFLLGAAITTLGWVARLYRSSALMNAERLPSFHSPQVAHSAMMTAVALYDRRMWIPLFRQTCEKEQWRCARRLNYDASTRIKR